MKYPKIITKVFNLKWAALAMGMLLLWGCKPSYPPNPRPVLHTTISSDGQMIATLLNAGTDQQRLRVLRLDDGEDWRDIRAPQFTQSIRFGLHGHELLLTHQFNGQQDRLISLDLDKPDGMERLIYQDDELGFPIEVSSGKVMVRTCPNDNNKGVHPCRGGFRWKMVDADGVITPIGPRYIGSYPAPIIVGTGFFWIDPQTMERQDPHPRIVAYPFPGGQAPDFARARLEKNTSNLTCDRQGTRCLRNFISNRGQAAAFIYDTEVLLGEERCYVEGVAGYSDGFSITPNGRAAVKSLAKAYDTPRHVVVMRFNPQQCKATSVQHINFKEE